MSWQDDVMAEQEADDYLMSLGEGERRELMEDIKEETDKRRVGRPRKTQEEKRANKKEYNARYWKENRGRILEQRKKYYQMNKDKLKKRSKEWVEENRDRWNEYQREWRKKKSKGGVDKAETV